MQNQGKLTWRMKVTRVTGIIWTCKGNDGVNKIKQNKFVKKKKKKEKKWMPDILLKSTNKNAAGFNRIHIHCD